MRRPAREEAIPAAIFSLIAVDVFPRPRSSSAIRFSASCTTALAEAYWPEAILDWIRRVNSGVSEMFMSATGRGALRPQHNATDARLPRPLQRAAAVLRWRPRYGSKSTRTALLRPTFAGAVPGDE